MLWSAERKILDDKPTWMVKKNTGRKHGPDKTINLKLETRNNRLLC